MPDDETAQGGGREVLAEQVRLAGSNIGPYKAAQTAIADLDREHIDPLSVGRILSDLRSEVVQMYNRAAAHAPSAPADREGPAGGDEAGVRLTEDEREEIAAEAVRAAVDACERRGRLSWAALGQALRETIERDVRGWALSAAPAVERILTVRLAAVPAPDTALRARVEALAETFEARKAMMDDQPPIKNARRVSLNALAGREASTWDVAAYDLRAALAAADGTDRG